MKSMRCRREQQQVQHVLRTTTIPAPAPNHEPHRSPGPVLGLEARSMRALPARAAAATSMASWRTGASFPHSATSGRAFHPCVKR